MLEKEETPKGTILSKAKLALLGGFYRIFYYSIFLGFMYLGKERIFFFVSVKRGWPGLGPDPKMKNFARTKKMVWFKKYSGFFKRWCAYDSEEKTGWDPASKAGVFSITLVL